MSNTSHQLLHDRHGRRLLFWAGLSKLLVGLALCVSDSAAASPPPGFSRLLVVAADGSGDFKTIQSAIDTIPRSSRERILIEVRDGVYAEKVAIHQDRITLRGQSRAGTQLKAYAPREDYDRRYDAIGPGVLNVFGDDLVIERMTIENTQPTEGHAFAIYGQPNRLILDGCDVLSMGGDTVSLWNTSHGMYYHRNCRFKGGVDFLCPRGWCYVRDSRFEAVGRSAMLWHDGHMDPSMKFVLRDCTFDGPEKCWLGRNHYPSQFYLINARFTQKLADKSIETEKKRSSIAEPALFERKYFWNCHRDGGDFAWFRDNLDQAAGVPSPDSITPKWTFDGRWDPEQVAPPAITSVETDSDQVYVQFGEDVVGAPNAVVARADGSQAKYVSGDGSSRLVFAGGDASAAPKNLEPGVSMYGAMATVAVRSVVMQSLPTATKRSEVTILLIGDSTVATQKVGRGLQGWGGEAASFFDDRVHIVNRARNGRSSKSFRDEGLWDEARKVKADYVLIEFGHNDNLGKGPALETDPAPGGDFRENLRRYVAEVRATGAKPILATSTTRRVFAKDGLIDRNDLNARYAEATRAVAKELNVPLLDMYQLTRDLFDRMGATQSNWLQPEGDNTHFSLRGARRVAAIATESLQQVVPELHPYVVELSLTHD